MINVARLGQPSTGVVVTGGASGIGLATAFALAEVGRPVAIWDIDADKAADAAGEIRAVYDAPVFDQVIDLTNLESLPNAVNATRQALGSIGGLVHSAGTAVPTGILGLTEELWGKGLDIHVRALAFMVQTLREDLKAAGNGAVVAIASINAHLGNGLIPIYSAAKGATLSLIRSMADDLANDGIRANTVSPGMIDTPMLAPNRDAMLSHYGNHIMLGRFGRPEEVARAIRFLLSNEASYITGTELIVDGGNIPSQR